MPATEQRLSWRRLPNRALAAVYAEHVVGILTMVVAALLSRQSDALGSRWAGAVIGVLLAARAISPLYTWSSLRFSPGAEGLWVATGIVNRRTRFTPWSAVVAVEVDEPWSHRIFGVARLTLLQGGDDATRTILPGLDKATATGLASRVHAHAPTPPSLQAPDDAGEEGPVDEPLAVPVYRSSLSDLLIASLIYGKFATFGAAAVLSALELLNTFGTLNGVSRVAAAGPWLIGLVVALSIMAAGAVTMVLRFGGLETVQSGAAVVIRYGLLSTRERVVAAEAIIGVELRRNLVEIALGRVRLTLITLDSATRLGSNLVLPSLRERDAAKVVAAPLFLKVLNQTQLPVTRLSALATGATTLLLSFGVAAVCSFLAVRALDVRLVYVVPVFALLLVIFYRVGSTALARLRVDRDAGSVSWTTAFVSYRQVTLSAAYVHLVSTVNLGARSVLVRIHYFAGMPRVLNAVRYDPVQLDWLTRAMSASQLRREGGQL